MATYAGPSSALPRGYQPLAPGRSGSGSHAGASIRTIELPVLDSLRARIENLPCEKRDPKTAILHQKDEGTIHRKFKVHLR